MDFGCSARQKSAPLSSVLAFGGRCVTKISLSSSLGLGSDVGCCCKGSDHRLQDEGRSWRFMDC